MPKILFLHPRVTASGPIIDVLTSFIKTHSWGSNFPFDPRDLLRSSDFICMAMQTNYGRQIDILGCGCVTRYEGCPDDYNDELPYLCCEAVRPNYRGRGFGTDIRNACVARARLTKFTDDTIIRATTDSPEAAAVLLKGDMPWMRVRTGRNEDGSEFTLWQLEL